MTHYWDPAAATGRWARDNLPWSLDDVPAWDVFYLFGRDATWTDRPDPVVATGYTIVRHRDALAQGLDDVIAQDG